MIHEDMELLLGDARNIDIIVVHCLDYWRNGILACILVYIDYACSFQNEWILSRWYYVPDLCFSVISRLLLASTRITYFLGFVEAMRL